MKRESHESTVLGKLGAAIDIAIYILHHTIYVVVAGLVFDVID